MELKEKYEEYQNLFFNEFIAAREDLDNPFIAGTHIPAESIAYDQYGKSVTIGDGTINIAEYMQYLFSCTLVDENPYNFHYWSFLKNALQALIRLSKRAQRDAQGMCQEMSFIYEMGFFLRDDISKSKFLALFKTERVRSGYNSSIELTGDEDPCYSPFVSQDQIWNLTPILSLLAKNNWPDFMVTKDSYHFLCNILRYVIDNGHVIYNPYYSTMKHYWTYCPTFDTNKVKPWERVKDRAKHLKYDIKVKRGANNWYFAYGFRKVYERFDPDKISKWKSFFYSLIYYPVIFVADRIWFPLLHSLFGIQKKDNSYYCLSTAGEVWYSGRKSYLKRVCKIFNESTDHWNVAFIECYNQKNFKNIDLMALKKWLNEYPILFKEGKIESPIKFLTLYNYYRYITEVLK